MPAFLSEAAITDLIAITALIARSSPQNASAFVRRVERVIVRIGRTPSAYPVRDDLPVAGLRTRSEPPCVIVFRVRERGNVEVVRVAHDRQDLAAFLLPS